ncbi:hypothetical protein ACOSQ3_005541 [Xanthoceras sorbifolium]
MAAEQNTQVGTLYNPPPLALVSEAEDTILVLEAESITPISSLKTEREERDCPSSSMSICRSSDPRDREVTQQMAFRRRVQPSHFFKVILNSTLEDKKLRIPEKFVRIFGDELSAVVTLTIPDGRVSRVGLTKDERKIWFDGGWNDFVQYHSIGVGHFLVFKYKKNSNFSVLIFDKSACETQYPYNGGKTVRWNGIKIRSKRCKIEVLDEINKLDAVGDKIENRRAAYKVGQHSLDEENNRIKCDEHELLALLGDMEIYPDNLKNRRVYVPFIFGDKYLSKDSKSIQVQDSDGREWSFLILWYGVFCIKRWAAFYKEKNLGERDICIFELIRLKEPLLKVSIFYASTK